MAVPVSVQLRNQAVIAARAAMAHRSGSVGVILPPRVLDSLAEAAVDALATRKTPRPGRVLTNREGEILELAAYGLTNAAIAAELHISENTVKGLLKRAYSRLGVNDRAHAVGLAYRQGLLRLPRRIQRRPR